METKNVPSYEEFNKFQTAFYTSKSKFNDFTRFEIKKHGFSLLTNLSKGFPALADIIFNLQGFNWKGTESPAIMKALQHKHFINNFNRIRIPDFVYYPTTKNIKEKEKAKKTSQGLIFSPEISKQIQSILFMDSKSYEYLMFSESVQNLGKQLLGEFYQTEKIKTAIKSTKTRKKK